MFKSSVPVCWWEGSLDADGRSHYADVGILNETFDSLGQLTHHSTFGALPPNTEGAVVVIHGGHLVGREAAVLADLNKLKWSLNVIVCDDESVFNTRMLMGPLRKLWQQMPIPGVHDFVDRKIICGYPCDARRHLDKLDKTTKPLDWFFAGQVNHPRRRDCVAQLRNFKNGYLLETAGFWQGLDRAEYYQQMVQAKIVPCPAGPVTPDTIRMAEALEAGCVPIIDPRPGHRHAFPNGFWDYVLGRELPFPIIHDWNTLPRVMEEQLAIWPHNQQNCMAWWAKYKQDMLDAMRVTIQDLRRDAKCE